MVDGDDAPDIDVSVLGAKVRAKGYRVIDLVVVLLAMIQLAMLATLWLHHQTADRMAGAIDRFSCLLVIAPEDRFQAWHSGYCGSAAVDPAQRKP